MSAANPKLKATPMDSPKPALAIRLLGRAEIRIDGAAPPAMSSRALPLLAILLVSDAPVTRDAMAKLLWRRVDAASALASLRQLLHHLPSALRAAIQAGRNDLAIDDTCVSECDVWNVRDALSKGAPVLDLIAHYAGALLADRVFDDLPEFDDWLAEEREKLASRIRQRVLAAAMKWRQQNSPDSLEKALAIAEAWLARDAMDEDVHAEVVQCHVLAGNIRAAETQYESLRRILATRAGRKPAPATQAILDNALRKRGSIRGTGLPALATSFVGRQDELAEMARMSADPHCRLITLHGPGGMGKTRLALAFAEETRRHDDDAYFVGLESAQSAQTFYAAIAASFGLELSPRIDAKVVLCEALRTFDGLLVLDNFEQLLPAAKGSDAEARDFLPTLLRNSPRLKLLVTSRVALGLQEEWLMPLNGLSFPSSDETEAGDVAADTAVELFTSRARQAYRGFSRSAELPHVLAICRAADGLPLALELAAAQVGNRPCAEIAQDLLATASAELSARASNRPERHASVRRVIEQSLAAVTTEQARAFASLALFQNQFTSAMSFAVARVRESTLQELTARALLQRVGDGYKLHPLLREFAAVRLARSRSVAARVEASYVTEMARRAVKENVQLLGPGARAAMATVSARFSDEMAALRLACRLRDTESVFQLATALVNTALARGLVKVCVEGWPPFDSTLPPLAGVALQIRRADLLRQIGEYERSLEIYAEVTHTLDSMAVDERDAAMIDNLRFSIHAGRAGLNLFRGSFTGVLEEHAAATLIPASHVPLAERIRMNSYAGFALMELGELEQAGNLLEACRLEAAAAGSSAMLMVMLLNALGNVAHNLGDLKRCTETHQQALAMLLEDGLQFMQSRHFCNLGNALLVTSGADEAQKAFERAIAIATTYGDIGPLTYSQIGLANARLMQDDLAGAADTANQARMNARRLGSVSLTAEATTLMMRVAIEQADLAVAARLMMEIHAETEGKLQGFRKLEVIFCGLKIAHQSGLWRNLTELSEAVTLLTSHAACKEDQQKTICDWHKSLCTTNAATVSLGNKSESASIDAALDRLLNRLMTMMSPEMSEAETLAPARISKQK